MWCVVYKSRKRAETYLFVPGRDQFDQVPPALLSQFGSPEFVLVCNLAKRDKLGQANLDEVKRGLSEQGFYLQLPPPPVNLLEQEKRRRLEQVACGD